MQYKLVVTWPNGTNTGSPSGKPVSEDFHNSKEHAEGVARMLRKSGFGGRKEIFPVSIDIVLVECKRKIFSGGGSPSPRLCDICGEGPCRKR